MRCVFSVVKFVPDPARGEFINVGAIVGSDDASEWQVRQLDNSVRARAIDDSQTLEAAWSFLAEIGREVDAFVAAAETLLPPEIELSEMWLWQLHHRHRNVVQLSEPTPMVAESVQAATDRIVNLLLVDPAKTRYPFKKKHTALAAVRQAYREQLKLTEEISLHERVTLEAPPYNERLDFAVANGEALQLTHTWSFQIPDQDRLAEQVKSWGWTIERLRSNGGQLTLPDGLKIGVQNNVNVAVVYIPPQEEEGSPALQNAFDVFEHVGATYVPDYKAAEVAQQATSLVDKLSS